MNIDLFITQNCNLSCVFCGAWKADCFLEQELSFIKTAMETALEKGYKFVTLSGGEPFLHPDIFEIIDYAHKLGLWVNITTNGLLINQETIDRLKNRSVNLRISLHSLKPETYNRIVKADAFDKVLSTIEILKKNHIYYSLGCTLFESNFNEISDMIAFAYDNHAQYVRFSPVVGILDGKDYSCDYKYYVKLLKIICENIIRFKDAVAIEKNKFSDKEFLRNYMCTRPCPASSKSFVIVDTDKNMIPCQFVLDQKYKVRFEGPESFDQMYRNKENEIASLSFEPSGKCGKCLYVKKCKGGCWANKITNGLPLDADQPICALDVVHEVLETFGKEEKEMLTYYWYTHFKLRFNEKDDTYCFRKLPLWEVNFKYRRNGSGETV